MPIEINRGKAAICLARILHSVAQLQTFLEFPEVWTYEHITVLKDTDNKLDYLLNSIEDTKP